MSHSGRSSLSRVTTLRESTPEFRSRLMRDQRTLSTVLTKLDVERSTQARLREDEIRQLKRELRSGLQTTTIPLDDMRVPGARLTELADRIRDGRGAVTLAAVGDAVNEAAARRKSHLDEPEKRGSGMGDSTRRGTMFGDDILHQRFKKEATPRDTKIFRTFYYSHLIVPDGLDDEDGDELF